MTEDPLSIVHSVVCCFISFHFASCSACHGDTFLELLLGDCEAAVLIWDWVNADMHTHSVHQTVNRQQGCKLSNNSRNTVYTLSRLLSLSLFTWQYQHIMMSLFYTSLSKILSFTGIHTKVVPLSPFLSMMERHMSWVLFHQDRPPLPLFISIGLQFSLSFVLHVYSLFILLQILLLLQRWLCYSPLLACLYL